MEISVNKDGEDLGPFSLEDIQAQLADGSLSLEDYAWFDGCEDWAYVADIPGVQAEGTSAPDQAGQGGASDGVYLEHNEEQKGPFPIPQLQGMVNQGVFPMDTPAWMEGWGDWGTIEDVPGIKKPRVKVSGTANPLTSLLAAGKSDKKDKKERKGKQKDEKEESGAEEGKKKGARTRRKKGRQQEKKTLKQRLVPIIGGVVLLIVLGVGGVFAYTKFFVDEDDNDDGGGIFSTIKKTVKEDPPPTDPWDLAKWRKARQR
jgi:hypothetical protein